MLTNKEIKYEARLLYDAGWNVEDKEELINSYNLNEEEVDLLLYEFKVFNDEFIEALTHRLYMWDSPLADYVLDKLYYDYITVSEIKRDIPNNIDYLNKIDLFINNILSLIEPIASNGYITVHDIIHGIDDYVLIRAYEKWYICEIEYNTERYYPNSFKHYFTLEDEMYLLEDFIKC